MPTNPTILSQSSDFVTASYRNLFILLWRGQTERAGIEATRRDLKATAARNPNGVYLLTVVSEKAPTPSAESKDDLAAVLADSADAVRASAVAFEGTGFRAAAVRAVVTGVNLVARQPFPHKVFSNVEEAADWLAREYPAGGLTSGEIREAVSEMRA